MADVETLANIARAAEGTAVTQKTLNAARAIVADAGMLVNAVVIPRPHPDVYREKRPTQPKASCS